MNIYILLFIVRTPNLAVEARQMVLILHYVVFYSSKFHHYSTSRKKQPVTSGQLPAFDGQF